LIGIDTNILVRYITQDDELQSGVATEFIENYCSNGNKIFVNHLVICELVWVIKKMLQIAQDQKQSMSLNISSKFHNSALRIPK